MKVSRQKRTFICLLIAFAITVSGMYFEKIKVDSSFANGRVSTESVLSSGSQVMKDRGDLCTRELLGLSSIRDNISQRASLDRERGLSKLFFLFSIPAVSLEQSLGRIEVESVLSRCKNSGTWHRIISYIHQQDGAKGH